MKFKKLLALALAAAFVLGAVSCKENGPNGSSSSSGGKEEQSVYEKYAEVPVSYSKKNAEYEDGSLDLWFDHAFSKTVKNASPNGRDTYKIYAAKNETENCQFFLKSSDSKNVTLGVSDFVNKTGETVTVKLFYQYYFTVPFGTDGEAEVPDPIPPVKEGQVFELSANSAQGFVLQAQTDLNTAAGEYTATLNVYENGRQIKTADVFLHVWNYTLSEDTFCRTAVWIEKYRNFGMDYKDMYDFLLSYRVNAYDLPYALSDGRVDGYLDNPRVNSFNILGFKYNKEAGLSDAAIKNSIAAAYQKLSVKKEWNDKGYFYLVDEPNPTEKHKLEWIKMYGEWLEELYPGYRQLSPFFTDEWYDGERDWIEFLRPYINIWVPKTYAYTTLREYGSIVGGKCLYKEGLEGELDAAFGSYPKRIKNMVEKDGDEAWWYVTSQPTNPYITFNINEPGVSTRILFWQQKLNGVTGLLYWSSNYWSGDGWNAAPNEWSAGNYTYGNGVLMYPGSKVGQNTPVASLRLESIRDGIEDYQAFTMLEEQIGTSAVNELICRTTTHVAKWSDSEDGFAGERIIAGNYLEALLGK